MEQAQKRREYNVHHGQCGSLSRFVVSEDICFRGFDEPVAIVAPEKIVKTLCDCIELIVTITCIDCVDRLVQARQNVDRIDRQLLTVDAWHGIDRKSTRLNSSHGYISYAAFCLKKK